MFDFVKIAEHIPNDESTLTVLFKKEGNDLIVVFTPNYKEQSEALSPVTVRDTPENLNIDFDSQIDGLCKDQKKLLELLKVKVAVPAKKAAVTKAIDKKSAEIAKADSKTTEKKDAGTKAEAPAPATPLLDLFAAATTKTKEEAKTEVATAEKAGVEYDEAC